MSQNQPEDNKRLPVDPNIIKSFLENQKIELKNKQTDQSIRLKEIESNTKLAEKSMAMQERYMINSGPDFRKNITRVAYIVAGFLIIILFFLGLCLYLNKDQFAYKIGQGISYLISLVIGGFIGRKTAPKAVEGKTNDEIQTFD